MGPLPEVPGAPAAACPASPRRLCPAPPPLGGAVGEGPRPRPPPTRSGRLHRYSLVPTPDGGGPEDLVHRGAQPPSQPHGGQAGAGYPAPKKPGPAGPGGEPPGDNHLLPRLQTRAHGLLCRGDSRLRAGPGGPLPSGGHAGYIPPGGRPHGAHEARPGQASKPDSRRPDHGSRENSST